MYDQTITSTLGSCIDLSIEYADENEIPENITNEQFDIYSASRPVFNNAILNVIDAAQGLLHFHLSAEDTAQLSTGSSNWFRIRRTYDGCSQVSEQIWVNMV